MTVRISTLNNGLRIVSDSFQTVETATLGVWVDVGARHEPAKIGGISHVLEHMAFKGTKKRSAKDIAEEVEAVGAYVNAYTGRENTSYHARLLKEDIPLIVDILADILQNSTFDATEFAREQAVICQEIGQAKDTPDDIIFDYFQEACFPNQSMGRPILGREEVINALTPDVVKDYMQRHYGAKQMVLAAAGNVDHDQLVDLAEKQFNSLTPDGHPLVESARYQGGDYRQAKDLEQVHVVLGFEGIPFRHDDYYTASILSTILGGGMSSRLFQEIREKRGLVYTIYSFTSSYRDTGVFGVYAGTGKKEVAELLPVVCEELRHFPTTLKETEINRAKAQLKASLMMSLESTGARCEQLAQHMLIYGKPILPSEILAKVEAVTKESIASLARRLFSEKPTLATLGPIEQVIAYQDLINKLQA